MNVALLGYEDAAALVSGHAAVFSKRPLRTERIDLGAGCGRVLARPICADADMPSFPRSTRDGFACRAAEASSHALLSIGGSIRAGDAPAGPLPADSAWEIMTGAAVPEGADAVAMVEHVERAGESVRLVPTRRLKAGENVVPMGAEAHAGDELIGVGTKLGPQHVAAAASCGYSSLDVYRRPRVAILTTGDELVPVDTAPAPGRIRNSNAPMLAALVALHGGDPWVLPAAKDAPGSLRLALQQAIEADLLLISGGVSAGKFDLVEPALAEFDARLHFTGIRMQPGKPLVFGELPRNPGAAADDADSLPLFGHPGNPISSAATFLLFAAPVLRALAGECEHGPCFLAAQLTREVKGKPELTRFVPATFSFTANHGELPQVAPVNWHGSGDLAAFARANCFVLVPEGIGSLDAGAVVRILPI